MVPDFGLEDTVQHWVIKYALKLRKVIEVKRYQAHGLEMGEQLQVPLSRLLIVLIFAFPEVSEVLRRGLHLYLLRLEGSF